MLTTQKIDLVKVLTALLVKLMIAKHASKVSLGHKLAILYFCEFIKEQFLLLLLAQKI